MIVDAHLHYFDTPDFTENLVKEMTVAELLPEAFTPEKLKK